MSCVKLLCIDIEAGILNNCCDSALLSDLTNVLSNFTNVTGFHLVPHHLVSRRLPPRNVESAKHRQSKVDAHQNHLSQKKSARDFQSKISAKDLSVIDFQSNCSVKEFQTESAASASITGITWRSIKSSGPYKSLDPLPETQPPPCKKTITGRGDTACRWIRIIGSNVKIVRFITRIF